MWHDPATWIALAFVIFVAAVARPLARMAAAALDGRSERIGRELEEARRLREEAQHDLAECERKQRDTGKDAEEIVRQGAEEARRLTERAAEELSAALKRRQEAAVARIASAEAAALKEVREAAIDLAVAAATRVLQDHVAGDAAGQLLDGAIRDLPARLNEAAPGAA